MQIYWKQYLEQVAPVNDKGRSDQPITGLKMNVWKYIFTDSETAMISL